MMARSLTDARVGSLLLGYVGLVEALPVILLALPAGQAADRYSRKSLVLGTQALLVVTALWLGIEQTRTRDRRASDLHAFNARVDEVVHAHPVVVDNRYTRWFARGEATREEVRHLTVQFSVFSHLFVEAQLRKVINAADIESYRAGKEILTNELGVVFNGRVDDEGVATDGTVDGSFYRHAAAHFEWLLRFAKPLGLEFSDLGKRRHATSKPHLLTTSQWVLNLPRRSGPAPRRDATTR